MDFANFFKGVGVNYIMIIVAAIHTLFGIYQIKKGTLTRTKDWGRFVLMAILGIVAAIATFKGIHFTQFIQTLTN